MSALAPAMRSLRGELARFLIVGLTAVAIDYATYRMLLGLSLAVALAKTAGFIAGALFAYFANRALTFRVSHGRSSGEALRFAVLYLVALGANVAVNSLVLRVLSAMEAALGCAFVAATAVSATMNFLGMKFFVFREGAASSRTSSVAANAGLPMLSLVIPCYNEARNLPLLVARLREVFAAGPHEVVLVDNGSTDDTPAVLSTLLVDTPSIRSVRVEVNRGYGFGIVAGLRAARGEVLGWTHADMQTDPADALAALEAFAGAENVFFKGRRYGRPLADVVFTLGMSVFETALLRRPLWDINAQPTLFRRAFFDGWTQPPDDFSLDLYAYVLARRDGLKVKRLPVRFGERAHGVSHWNVNWQAKMKFIRRTLDFSLRLRRELAAAR